MFLLALPSGALADIVDRRRLLLAAQSWMLVAAAALAALAFLGAVTPLRLLACTFALGIGTALNAPAWHAIVSELVPPKNLVNALVLNGIAINVARAVGPALGGLVIAGFGPAAAFLLNSLSFLAVIHALYRWRRVPMDRTLPPERLFGAIRSGFRYVRRAPNFQAVVVRSGAFMLCGSALWALLPLIARVELESGPTGYGLLLGSFGAGAIIAALAVPRLRSAFSIERLLAVATTTFALVTALVAHAPDLGIACLGTLTGGFAWLVLLSTLNVTAQTAVPSWVRARALAVYLLVFFGAMTAGSSGWGLLAGRTGIPAALALAAMLMMGGLLLSRRFPIVGGDGVDLAPDVHWPAPQVVDAIQLDRGPVLVTLDYRIDPATAAEFSRVMDQVRVIRERDGAIVWGLFVDAADPTRYVESFLVDSWVEHLRQHERTTVADRATLERASRFHLGADGPVVSHLIASE
jgi:MFS family permease